MANGQSLEALINEGIELIRETPASDEFRSLRVAAGLSPGVLKALRSVFQILCSPSLCEQRAN